MHRLTYFARTALRGIRRAPLRSLMAAGAIAVALAVLGGYLLVYVNLEGFLGGWGRQLDLSVFLADEVSVAQRNEIELVLRSRPEVAEVRFVDRALALQRLRRDWPQHGALLAGAADDLVEAAFEVRLGTVAQPRAALAAVSRAVRGRAGVVAVDYGAEELRRVERALDMFRGAGTVLAVLLGLAALFVIGITIRLAIRDRRDELEIMKLCGATDRFIRIPLYLEGALQGAVGGALALGLVALLHGFLGDAIADLVAGPASGTTLAFPLSLLAAVALGGGAALGALGSALAAGRYLRS